MHGLPSGVCETRPVTNDSLTNEVCMCLRQPIHNCLTLSDQPDAGFLGEFTERAYSGSDRFLSLMLQTTPALLCTSSTAAHTHV